MKARSLALTSVLAAVTLSGCTVAPPASTQRNDINGHHPGSELQGGTIRAASVGTANELYGSGR